MTTQKITFDEFMVDLGIPRVRQGVKKMLARYAYLNRALDLMLKNPMLQQEEVFLEIAKEQNVSSVEVEQQIQYAINEILSRRQQKKRFTKIFGKERNISRQEFLKRIVKAYYKLSSKRGP